MESEIIRAFGNRLRVRACGICVFENKLLLIKHRNLSKAGYLWAPPGGGVSFGESVEECLVREFQEETGLTVKVNDFLFFFEFMNHPLHSIELFFEVEVKNGTIIRGIDPELKEHQIIEDVKYCDDDFLKLENKDALHGAIVKAGNISELRKLRGYVRANP
jgi:8-oxo-dGTP diphosphatase